MFKVGIIGLSITLLACGKSKPSQVLVASAPTSESLPGLLDSTKVSAVARWGDRLCVARRLDDGYELAIYRKDSSKNLVNIYTNRFDGIYQLDGATSKDFLIVYGSSAVATQLSLLRWDAERQKVMDFNDPRFIGDSRRQPEILISTSGFQILTFGNLHDMGDEPDESKWYASIYTFSKGSLVSAEKTPYAKRYTQSR